MAPGAPCTRLGRAEACEGPLDNAQMCRSQVRGENELLIVLKRHIETANTFTPKADKKANKLKDYLQGEERELTLKQCSLKSKFVASIEAWLMSL